MDGRIRKRYTWYLSYFIITAHLFRFPTAILDTTIVQFREFGSVTSLSVLEAPNAGVKKLDEDKSKGIVLSSQLYINMY